MPPFARVRQTRLAAHTLADRSARKETKMIVADERPEVARELGHHQRIWLSPDGEPHAHAFLEPFRH